MEAINGRERISRELINTRYDWLSLINNTMVAIWFLIGSILFLQTDSERIGVWFFIGGSAQMLLESVAGVARRIHLRQYEGELDRDRSRFALSC